VLTDEQLYTLHSLNATRWSCRVDNYVTLIKVLSAIKAMLELIVDDDLYDLETPANALSLLKCTDFQFCLVLCIMAFILSEAHVVSKYECRRCIRGSGQTNLNPRQSSGSPT